MLVTPFRYDGHGINDGNGERLAKLTTTLLVENREDFDRLGELLAAAPSLDELVIDFAANILDEYERTGAITQRARELVVRTINRFKPYSLNSKDTRPETQALFRRFLALTIEITKEN